MTGTPANWYRSGTGLYDTCKAGVDYESVKDTSERPSRWPCTGHCAVTCPKFEHWTEAEIVRDEQVISDYIKKIAAFSSGESRVCPMCGEPVTGATLYAKIEPEVFSLYVRPCDCRLGLWGKAPDWITDVQIIPLEDEITFTPEDESGEVCFDPETQERAGQKRLFD